MLSGIITYLRLCYTSGIWVYSRYKSCKSYTLDVTIWGRYKYTYGVLVDRDYKYCVTVITGLRGTPKNRRRPTEDGWASWVSGTLQTLKDQQEGLTGQQGDQKKALEDVQRQVQQLLQPPPPQPETPPQEEEEQSSSTYSPSVDVQPKPVKQENLSSSYSSSSEAQSKPVQQEKLSPTHLQEVEKEKEKQEKEEKEKLQEKDKQDKLQEEDAQEKQEDQKNAEPEKVKDEPLSPTSPADQQEARAL